MLPGFSPNLYDLAGLLQADSIVLQDRAVWSRKGRVHRALIRNAEGTGYIHIPVRSEDRKKPVNQVRIDHGRDWAGPLLKTLSYNYRNSLYFDFYEPEIAADFRSGSDYEYLLPFVLYLRGRLFRFLDLHRVIVELPESECGRYDADPDRFVENMGAVGVFQEHDSRHYQRQAAVRSDPDFTHPVYRQHIDGFEPWCCLYDLLFQYGPESFRIIDRLKGGAYCTTHD